MARTLADMAAEERAECVGMWCKSPAVRADVRVILLTDSGMVFFPAALKTGRLDPSIITPCHDLPRAWTPDGEPELAQALAEETWEYSYHVQNTIGMWEHPTVRADDPERWWETKEEAEESALAAHEYGYPIRIVRRRVSPVEVINE